MKYTPYTVHLNKYVQPKLGVGEILEILQVINRV